MAGSERGGDAMSRKCDPRKDRARKRRLRRRQEAWEAFEEVLAEVDERLNYESHDSDLWHWSYRSGPYP
jgi:hypothetical protein